MELKKSQVWKEQGLFEMIQLSRVGPTYSSNMLLTGLQFLESLTNTFQLRCGMNMLTLLSIAAIIGLRTTGNIFDPTQQDECTINFSIKRTRYNNVIIDILKAILKMCQMKNTSLS